MDFAAARHNMVECQIRTNHVTDAHVIDALRTIPREVFVSEPLKGVAYVDDEIALERGRFILDPMVFARMIAAARIRPGEIVLDVGCGSGYSAAVLASLATTVIATESDPGLAERAVGLLAGLGIDNVAVIAGSLVDGAAAHGPYNVIVVEGATPDVPEVLANQLAEGGRMVSIVARTSGLGHATLTMKIAGNLSSRVLFEAASLPLPGFEKQANFVF
jgi:protein-L-isoaspartate(D-aspartate) O-methyltransferase